MKYVHINDLIALFENRVVNTEDIRNYQVLKGFLKHFVKQYSCAPAERTLEDWIVQLQIHVGVHFRHWFDVYNDDQNL